jgi:hypothetical protein
MVVVMDSFCMVPEHAWYRIPIYLARTGTLHQVRLVSRDLCGQSACRLHVIVDSILTSPCPMLSVDLTRFSHCVILHLGQVARWSDQILLVTVPRNMS